MRVRPRATPASASRCSCPSPERKCGQGAATSSPTRMRLRRTPAAPRPASCSGRQPSPSRDERSSHLEFGWRVGRTYGGATQSRVAAIHSEAEQATNSWRNSACGLYKLNHADNPPTGSQRASKSFLSLFYSVKKQRVVLTVGRVLGTGRGITHRSSTLECAVSPSSVRGVKRASCSSTLRGRASVRVASCVSGVQICILRSTLRAFTPEA
jgi:hypothetical protein